MLWDCPNCGCGAIAPDIDFCPQCFRPRAETDVPAEVTGASPASGQAGLDPSQAHDGTESWGEPDAKD